MKYTYNCRRSSGHVIRSSTVFVMAIFVYIIDFFIDFEEASLISIIGDVQIIRKFAPGERWLDSTIIKNECTQCLLFVDVYTASHFGQG